MKRYAPPGGSSDMSRTLYYDAWAMEDVWIERLPHPIEKPVEEITCNDVEYDGDNTIIRYHGVEPRRNDISTLVVTYDAIYSDADIEDSEWRQTGQWGYLTTVRVSARVVYMILEEEEI